MSWYIQNNHYPNGWSVRNSSDLARMYEFKTLEEAEAKCSALNGSGDGLTKRERFAMAAMQGLSGVCDSTGMLMVAVPDIASLSVEYADAVLAELDKEQSA